MALSAADGISLTRLFSAPVLCHWILAEEHGLALGGVVLAGLSDGLDGAAARRWGASGAGKALDAVADKAVLGGVVGSLCYAGLLPGWLAALVLGRDLSLLAAGWWRGTARIRVLALSKLNTCVGFAAVAAILTHAAGWVPAPGADELVGPLCALWGSTTVASGVAYLAVGWDWWGRGRRKLVAPRVGLRKGR